MTVIKYVEYGGQLASVYKPARKYCTAGYYILPAPNGLGDGFGAYVWVDEFYVRSHALPDNPYDWYPIIGGLEARWVEQGLGRDYRVMREVRRRAAEEGGCARGALCDLGTRENERDFREEGSFEL